MNRQIRAFQKLIQAAAVGLFACAMAAQAQVPAFFNGQTSVGSGVYYLQFPDENLFGYYSYLSGSWIYHQDMGYEYYEDGGSGAIYFYDNATTLWFYTTASEFPYLQVISGPLTGDTLWYYLDQSNPQHYSSTPRYFFDIPACNTTPCPAGQVIQLSVGPTPPPGSAIDSTSPTTPNSLSINGGGNSATTPTNTAVTLALGYSDATPNSANDIWSGKVNLADASGNVWCPMTWQRTPGTTNPITVSVALDDAASGTQSDGFCTVTAGSGSYPANPTTTSGPVNVTITLSVMVAGTYTVQSAVYDMQGLESSLGQLGTLTTVAPDFTIGLSSPATTMAGGSATYTVTVTPVANSGFSGQVQLSAPSLPANASASFSPATITGSGTSTMTVTAPGSAGNIAVVATGTSGPLTHNASSTLAVQDFSVAMSSTYPSPVTVAPGGQAIWTILTSGLNGFGQQGQTIGLSFSPASIGNLPACAGLGNVTWSAYSVTPGQTDTLTLTAGPSNQYWCTFEVAASNGSLHHVLKGYLVQQGTGGFVLSQPAQQTVAPGQTASFAAPYTPYAGFTGSVAYSVSGNLPSGATTSFTALASPALGDALSVYVPPGVLAGTYVLQITATGPNGCTPPALGSSNSCISQTAYTQLVVQSGQGFSITATPQTSTTVAPGGTAQYNISVNSTGGYTGSINLSLSGTPSGATATLSSYSVQAGGAPVTLTVATTANTPLSIYSIVVTGTNGSVSQYGAAPLIVTLPSAASMLTPPPGANLAGGNTTFTWSAGLGATQYTVTATAANGQTISATTGPGQLSAPLSLPAISQTATVSLQTTTASGAPTQYYSYTIQPSGTVQGLTLAQGNKVPSVPTNGQEVFYTFVYTSSDGARPSPQDLTYCESNVEAILVRIASLSVNSATLGFTAPIGTPDVQFDWGCDDGGGMNSGGSGTGSTGDPTPVIDSVTPGVIAASAITQITILGENFGSSGGLDFGGGCSQSGDPSSWTDISIVVDVSVSAGASGYCTVAVNVATDASLNSFLPAAGSSSESDPFYIPIAGASQPPAPTISLTSVSWNLYSSTNGSQWAIMKDNPAPGGWPNDTYASNGSTAIINPLWKIEDGALKVQDPVVYKIGDSPGITSATFTMSPAPAEETYVMVRILADAPQPSSCATPGSLAFPDEYVNFGSNGQATSGGFSSTTTFSTVHNHNYSLTWCVSLDEGTTFQPFATSTQQIFVTEGGLAQITLNGTSQGTWTAKRLDFATRAAEGKVNVTGNLVNNPSITTSSPSALMYTTYGVTEAVIATVADIVSPGPDILGRYLLTQSTFWSILDTASTDSADCIAQAGLAAFAIAQLGMAAGYSWAYPPLAPQLLPPVTDATTASQEQLLGQYQDNPYQVLYYTLYYNVAIGPPNIIEGYLQVSANGQTTGFTVDPPAGPFTPTTCEVYPDTGANPVAFNVISQTLMGITISLGGSLVGSGSKDLFWQDDNSHLNGAPPAPDDPPSAPAGSAQVPLYTITRTGCQASDLLPAPAITLPIK